MVDLMWNKFTGEFPDTYARLENLRVLDFSQNSLKGIIPHSLTAIDSLEVLNLEENQLTGPLPAHISGGKLKDLRIGNNHLTGEIPNYNGLESLSLSGNRELDVALYADNLSDVPILDISVKDCEFPRALVNAERISFSISSMYTSAQKLKCNLNSSEVATWGVIKSSKLEELGFLGGFYVNFTSDIVDVMVNDGGANARQLLLSNVPLGPKYLRRELYHGHLIGVRYSAINDIVQPVLPKNIGSLHKLSVIIAAYGRSRLPAQDGSGDIISLNAVLPASLKDLAELEFFIMPNYKSYAYGFGSKPLEDPHGVLAALIAKNTLYALDIRGNDLKMDIDEIFNENYLPESFEYFHTCFLLLGSNNLYNFKTSADQAWLKVLPKFNIIRVFDINNNPYISAWTGHFDLSNWWICSHMTMSRTGLYGGLPGLPCTLRMFEGSNTYMGGPLVEIGSDLGDLSFFGGSSYRK